MTLSCRIGDLKSKIGILRSKTAILFLCIAILTVGLFNEYMSAAFSVILAIRIIVLIFKNRSISLKINSVTSFVSVTVFGYLVSTLWAVDTGVAIFGFIKFLPLGLYMLLCFQEGVKSDEVLKVLPYFAAIITLVTAILMQFKSLESAFAVAGRLSGTFQYANTYAVFCLVSLILLLADGEINLFKILTALVLLFGIMYSGSRTVFILTAISLLVLFFRIKSKKLKLYLLSAAVLAVIAFVGYAIVTDNIDTIKRLTRISFLESTFVGRILYWYDAFPTLIRRPFGTGFLGYYFMQNAFKTGVYSVMFVHNDFLQIALDIGWVPLGMLLFAIGKSLFSKNISFARKFATVIFSLHIIFDFDLQFVAMFIILFLLLDWEGGKSHTAPFYRLTAGVMGVAALVSLYFGAVTYTQFIDRDDISVAMYKFNTLSQIKILPEIKNTNQLNETAELILTQNKYVSLAYSAKARYYYTQGDFANVILCKRRAIENNYYYMSEYNDFFEMLKVGVAMYERMGDEYSADACRQEIEKIPNSINGAINKVSSLGKKIDAKPYLEVTWEMNNYISEMKKNEN